MAHKDDLGRRGEELAARWLEGHGWNVLARNWRGTSGELDIVALDGGVLVGVEVKTRTSLALGHPAEAVTPRKVARLRVLLGEWLAQHPDTRADGVRLDVVAILWPPDGEPRLAHLRAVA